MSPPGWKTRTRAASELTLWVIFAHVGFVLYLFGGKRLLNSLPLLKEKMP
uniref:Uncharacterized protein n=1 Tax=Magnetospirillum gryphiswaldense TaxID=55518 RepID=A4TZD1_9PROT|nr:hypothetical protein MGR_3316 [Magnetospirillum gryphiswaldense MSR-1]